VTIIWWFGKECFESKYYIIVNIQFRSAILQCVQHEKTAPTAGGIVPERVVSMAVFWGKCNYLIGKRLKTQ